MAQGRFREIRHDEDKPEADEAAGLLKSVARKVKPVMEKYDWNIHCLREFDPGDEHTFSEHREVDEGWAICLRLREADDDTSFLPPNEIVDSLLQELATIEAEEKDIDYDNFIEKVRETYSDSVLSGIGGLGSPKSGQSPAPGSRNSGISPEEEAEDEQDRLRGTIKMVEERLHIAENNDDERAQRHHREMLNTLNLILERKQGTYDGRIKVGRLRRLGWLCPNCSLFMGRWKWFICPECQILNTPAAHARAARQRKEKKNQS